MNKYAALLVFPLLIAIMSCEPCRYADCTISESMAVEYHSLADSSDLYQTDYFHLDSVKIWVMERPDSIPVAINVHSNIEYKHTEFYIETISPNLAGFIFSPRDGLMDTLWVNLKSGPNSKCCGSPNLFDTGLLNSVPVQFSGDRKVLKIYR